MARVYIAEFLRRRVEESARSRCGYCLTPQEFTAMPMHLEHIIPIAAGGKTIEENLWLACPLCNGHKSTKTVGVDSETGRSVTLFNPRRQDWQIHFEWSPDAVKIIGLTPVGRATVDTLQLNNKYLIQARRRWVLAGWHPPEG